MSQHHLDEGWVAAAETWAGVGAMVVAAPVEETAAALAVPAVQAVQAASRAAEVRAVPKAETQDSDAATSRRSHGDPRRQ